MKRIAVANVLLTVLLHSVAQAQEYRRASSGTELLSAPSGLAIRVLLDSAALGSGELEIGEITFPPGGPRGGGHRHGSIEIFYVLSGELDHVVNGVSHRLTPGMLGVVRPGDSVQHVVVGSEPVRALVIWAPGGELGRIAPSFQRTRIED